MNTKKQIMLNLHRKITPYLKSSLTQEELNEVALYFKAAACAVQPPKGCGGTCDCQWHCGQLCQWNDITDKELLRK